jgi:hypothetical protein
VPFIKDPAQTTSEGKSSIVSWIATFPLKGTFVGPANATGEAAAKARRAAGSWENQRMFINTPFIG